MKDSACSVARGLVGSEAEAAGPGHNAVFTNDVPVRGRCGGARHAPEAVAVRQAARSYSWMIPEGSDYSHVGLDQLRRVRPCCSTVTLSFLYQLLRRLLGLVRAH